MTQNERNTALRPLGLNSETGLRQRPARPAAVAPKASTGAKMFSVPTTPPPDAGLLKPSQLESQLLERVVGQPAAVQELVRCYTRYRAGLAPSGRPAGIFLMIGPTGSGKSLLATQFAKLITGSPHAPLRIDCGEYQQAHEVSRLIGAPPGYLGHRETTPVLAPANLQRQWLPPERQLSVVLLDEIDKAHPRFWDILLGVFDTGSLALGDGTRVDFVPTIVLMTGNIGSRAITESLAPSWGLAAGTPVAASESTARSAEHAARKLVRPEMFNRIDKVLVFQQLTRADLPRVLELELEDLRTRLAGRRIQLSLTDPAAALICDDGLDLRYGARHLKRAISQHLEIPLSNAIVDGTIRDGSTVTAHLRDGAISFQRL